ncbi:unnamed protein product [Brassica rapa subsp. narinosa]
MSCFLEHKLPPLRSTVGIVSCEGGGFRLVKAERGAWNMAGISVIPESARPFTPALVWSKAFA